VTHYLRQVWAIAAKDLRIELRTRERFASMGAFVVLTAFLFDFGIDRTRLDPGDIAAALIWMIVIHAGLLGLGRTFELEKEDGAFEGLLMAPLPRDALYLGKVAANFVLLGITVALAVATVGIVFRVNFSESFWALVAVLGVGVAGFTALGTLFGAITAGTRMGSTLLPVLVFPLLTPLVIYGADATATLLAGFPASAIGGTFRMILAFTLVSLVAGMLLFRYVVEE
jgi:heme exporter protein B